jgi:hypothetical protein
MNTGEQGQRGADLGPVPGGAWARSWFAVRCAWSVLRADRGMQVVALLGALLTALAAVAVFDGLDHLVGGLGLRRDRPVQPVSVPVVMLVVSLPITVLSTFTNVMLVAMAQARFDGGRMSPGAALAFAGKRLPVILGWSLLAVTVGALMRLLTEKLPLGWLLALVGGLAWSVAAMFAIPVLVIEGLGPVGAVKRSVAVFRARWGEGITGSVQVGGLSLAVIVPGLLLLGGGIAADETALAVVGVAALAIGLTAAKAFGELFALAIYRDAVLGAGSFGLAVNQLDAFVERKRR